MRLDIALVERGFFESRNRAKEAIRDGKVKIDGEVCKKASMKISEDASISVEDINPYVSRAALKLKGFLDNYYIDLGGYKALDIGSSTGGFTQVLLESGVKSIDSVDVGREQMHPMLRDDKRVNLYEETDIREFHSDKEYDIIVSDISFISLRKVLPYIDKLAKKDTKIVLLFKPQFEVGKDAKRDKRGVVKDLKAIEIAKREFLSDTRELGWSLEFEMKSPIKGKEGNEETIFYFKK